MPKKKKKRKQVKKKQVETKVEGRDSPVRGAGHATDVDLEKKIGTSGTGPRLF